MSTTAQHWCTQWPAYASTQHTHTRGSKYESTRQQVHTHQARSTAPASAGGPDTRESRDWDGDRAGHGRRQRRRLQAVARRVHGAAMKVHGAASDSSYRSGCSHFIPVSPVSTASQRPYRHFSFLFNSRKRYSRDARITGVSCVSAYRPRRARGYAKSGRISASEGRPASSLQSIHSK